MGFYSAEPIRATATNVREFHRGPNAVMPIIGDRGTAGSNRSTDDCNADNVCGWDLVEQWLDRSDEVGAAVFYPLDTQYSCQATPACLEAITTIVNKVKHHRCIVGWYVADEPDGANPNTTTTDANAALLGKMTQHIRTLDPRPTSICVDSTSPFLSESLCLCLIPLPGFLASGIYLLHARPAPEEFPVGAPPSPPGTPGSRHNFPAFLPHADVIWADIYPVDHHWNIDSSGSNVDGQTGNLFGNGLSVAYGIQLLRNQTIKLGFPNKREHYSATVG